MAAVSKRTIIIAGILAATVSVAAGVLYYQYQKLMQYSIKFKSMMVRTFSANSLVVDLYLLFENNSNLNFDITSQSYAVFINGKEVASASNKHTTSVVPGTNNIAVRVSFNPAKALNDLGGIAGILGSIGNAASTKIRFDIKLSVKLWKIIPVNVPMVVDTTLAELTSKKP